MRFREPVAIVAHTPGRLVPRSTTALVPKRHPLTIPKARRRNNDQTGVAVLPTTKSVLPRVLNPLIVQRRCDHTKDKDHRNIHDVMVLVLVLLAEEHPDGLVHGMVRCDGVFVVATTTITTTTRTMDPPKHHRRGILRMVRCREEADTAVVAAAAA